MTLVVSPAILDEYHRVGRLLAERYEGRNSIHSSRLWRCMRRSWMPPTCRSQSVKILKTTTARAFVDQHVG